MKESVPSAHESHEMTPRIYVPSGWGTGTRDVDSHELMLLALNPGARKIAEGRRMAEQRVRTELEGNGVQFVEMNDPADADLRMGFLERGAQLSPEREMDIVSENVPEIRIPRMCPAMTYLDKPFLPALLMISGLAGGDGKFLIEDEEQLQKITSFLRSPESGALARMMVAKEFIRTPSDRYTSYRVIVTAKGDIVASALIYSGTRKSDPEFETTDKDPGALGGRLTNYLISPRSEYFIRPRKVISNVAGGGGCIPLNPTAESRPLTEDEKVIARDNGLDADVRLPEDIAKAAVQIGKTLGREMGLFVGVDFLRDENGNVYYLETNAGPGLKTYVDSRMHGTGSETEAYERILKDTILSLMK